MNCSHVAPASCPDCDGTNADAALFDDRYTYEQACHTGAAARTCAYDVALLELLEVDTGELAEVTA